MTEVRVFHNETEDHFMQPYTVGDQLFEVFHTTSVQVAPSAVLDEMFWLLNVGTEMDYSYRGLSFPAPDPRAQEYRASRLRSLSVGDVLDLSGLWYAVARFGFTPIQPPAPTSIVDMVRS